MKAVIPVKNTSDSHHYHLFDFTIVPDTPDPVVVLQAAVQGRLGLPRVPDDNHSVVASSGQQVLFVWVKIQRPDVSLQILDIQCCGCRQHLRGRRMDELPRRCAGPTIPSRHLTSTCCGYLVAIPVRIEPAVVGSQANWRNLT